MQFSEKREKVLDFARTLVDEDQFVIDAVLVLAIKNDADFTAGTDYQVIPQSGASYHNFYGLLHTGMDLIASADLEEPEEVDGE